MRTNGNWRSILALLLSGFMLLLAACGGVTSTPTASPTPSVIVLQLLSVGEGDIVGSGPQNPCRSISGLYQYNNNVQAQIASCSFLQGASSVSVFVSDSTGVHHTDPFPAADSQGISTQTLSLPNGPTYTIAITKKGENYSIVKIVQSN